MLGWPHSFQRLVQTLNSSVHSEGRICWWQLSSSARTLHLPCMNRMTNRVWFRSAQHSRFFTTSQREKECVPPWCFMYARAVVLSACTTVVLCTCIAKCCIPRKFAFNSFMLICISFSSEDHFPETSRFPRSAPQPTSDVSEKKSRSGLTGPSDFPSESLSADHHRRSSCISEVIGKTWLVLMNFPTPASS